MRLTANMLGQKMDIALSGLCIEQAQANSPYSPTEVMYFTANLLERPDIAGYMLGGEVKIGETVALMDHIDCCLLILRVGIHEIVVDSLYYYDNHPICPVGADCACIVLPVFGSIQTMKGLLFRQLECA